MTLLDTCLQATGRQYPDGYGFALAYLTESPGVDHFKAMQAAAFAAVQPQAKAGNPDAAAFVAAYADSKWAARGGWPQWLIEAAQLVLAAALSGNRKAQSTLSLWNHPGYSQESN